MINPIFAYSHVATGCSTLTGGAFVPDGVWPGYDGAYMYADFSCGKIYTLSDDCGSWMSTTFAAGLGGVTDLEFVGNELWYGSYDGVVHRIVPPPSPVGGTASRYVPIAPTRKLDTRNAIGGPTAVVPAGGTRTVSLAPEVPAGAVAAVVNVTITGALAPGFVTAWPADKPRPGTSTLNVVQAGQTVPNTALLALSPSQTINVFTQSGGHLIVDVYGYYVPSGATAAGRFTSLPPAADPRHPHRKRSAGRSRERPAGPPGHRAGRCPRQRRRRRRDGADGHRRPRPWLRHRLADRPAAAERGRR